MIDWTDIIKFTNNGTPPPDKRVEKTPEEWKAILTPQQYEVTRLKGTERAFSGEFCEKHEPGLYGCICCDTLLFDSTVKFESGTGWPSFTQPYQMNAIRYEKDTSHGMARVEILCNTCDAHLGHVFPDGPTPGGLRYCVNSIAIKHLRPTSKHSTAVVGGGCFWCIEAIFQRVKGVIGVVSGYSGGQIKNPTYKEVCSGKTGYAEVVQVTFDPDKISYENLLRIFFTAHDPTTLNQQGNDLGTQYRSVIFYQTEAEKTVAEQVIEEMQPYFDNPIVTELSHLPVFYKAEDYHQNYYDQNVGNPYCTVIISPKIAKLRAMMADYLVNEVTE